MQTVPDRPAGLHRSLPIVAWIEWKLVQVLKGNWNFRSFDSKSKSYVEQLANTKKHALKGGKFVNYNNATKTMMITLPDQVAAQEATAAEAAETGPTQAE